MVSKNAGGTKRVTSLADALKLNFGMVTTDKRRDKGGGSMSASMILTRPEATPLEQDPDDDVDKLHIGEEVPKTQHKRELSKINTTQDPPRSDPTKTTPPRASHNRQESGSSPRRTMPSPLRSAYTGPIPMRSPLVHAESSLDDPPNEEDEDESSYTDGRAKDITQGRLVHGHIVPDDYPSPTASAMSTSMILDDPDKDPLEMSRASSFFNPEASALGGTADAVNSDDEEEESFRDPETERMITLVGDVKNRTVFIVDDMIDKPGSWIAAAETVVKRGGAKKVFIIATHGLFGEDSLEQLQDCDCIDTILVTNSFPIPESARAFKKLVVLDLSHLLAEAIRRNHYGESISALFSHSYDS